MVLSRQPHPRSVCVDPVRSMKEVNSCCVTVIEKDQRLSLKSSGDQKSGADPNVSFLPCCANLSYFWVLIPPI